MNQSEPPFETSAPARSPAGESRDPRQQDVRPRIALILGGMLARHWLRLETASPRAAISRADREVLRIRRLVRERTTEPGPVSHPGQVGP